MSVREEKESTIDGIADGIAISQEDFGKYGCINPKCRHYGHPADMANFSENVTSKIAKLLRCKECGTNIIALAAGVTISPISLGGKSCHRLSDHSAKKSNGQDSNPAK